MSYDKINEVWSPRLHLLNILRNGGIFSEFPKENFIQVTDNTWYYFSEELLEKDFDFSLCITWKTSKDFMKISGYSRPKINTYIEQHWRIIYLNSWYYDIEKLKVFVQKNIKPFVEKRGRPIKNK